MKTINYGIMQVQTDEGFMKTPTKEQIEKVMSKSCAGVMVCRNCPYQGHCFAMAKKFITELEKIRS